MAAPSPIPDPLIGAYAKAWTEIEDWQLSLVDNPRRETQRRRLLAQQAAISSDMRNLDALLAAWLTRDLPLVYRDGAGGDVTWNTINRDAVRVLAERTYTDLLLATQHVDVATRRLVQTVANDELLRQLIIGQDTAVGASRRMRKILNVRGITAVTYRNGARVGLGSYSEMALRTVSATAFNTGTVNGAPEVAYFEVFDGTGCGWTSHSDPQHANGMVVSREDALAYPISHPQCRRGFGPRSDVTKVEFRRLTSGQLSA